MKESSTQENTSKNSQSESASTGSLPASLTFHLKSGVKINKTALVHPGNFHKFKENILDQLCKDGNIWFYFIEYEKPHRSSLFRIDDIACVEIQEYEELSKEQISSLLDKYKARASVSGLI